MHVHNYNRVMPNQVRRPRHRAARPASVRNSSTSLTTPETQKIVMDIFNKINAYRQSQGKSKLVLDQRISKEAEKHSKTMANIRKISHDGFSTRCSNIQSQMSGTRGFAENVAMNMERNNPGQKAVSQWIGSSGHRTNMLGNYTKTGIAVSKSRTGEYYFTQIFVKA